MKIIKPLFFSIVIILCTLHSINAQIFERVDVDFKEASGGSATWCDYNNDGILDFFVTGYNIGGINFDHGTIYNGMVNGLFTESNIFNITKVIYSAQAFADYDNDGDIDLLLCGTRSGFDRDNRTDLYENINGQSFQKTNDVFEKLKNAYVEWVDYDNDGDLDLFLMGYNVNSLYVIRLYVNNGDKTFTESDLDFNETINYSSRCAKWDDFNNDGLKDIILSQPTLDNEQTTIYRNLGDDRFLNVDTTNIPYFNYKNIETGDYNNDGLLDLLVWAFDQSKTYENPVILYKNIGNFRFAEVWRENIIHDDGTIDLVDMNNDGLSDILVYSRNGNYGRLYFNDGDDDFSFSSLSDLPESYWSGGAYVADYDNDFDLDILVHGTTSGSATDAFTEVYKNVDINKNTPPLPPVNFNVTKNHSNVIISWDAGTDNETPALGLSYNLSVGTTYNGGEILSSHTTTNGTRQLIDNGNTKNNFYFLRNLPPGEYYCAVQSIDNGYCSSEMSETISFTIDSASTSSLDFDVYPIPTSSMLTIEAKSTSGQSHVKIYNAYSQLVFDNIYYGKLNEEIDVSFLPLGIYYVQLLNNGKSKAKTIIVE
jgi:hypothetical protein